MNEYPGPSSVLMLDNAKVHHTDALQDLAATNRIMLVFFPPYSPFVNPTEKIFSKVKSFLARHGSEYRRLGFTTDQDRLALLNYAFDHVDGKDCQNFVRHCGLLICPDSN